MLGNKIHPFAYKQFERKNQIAAAAQILACLGAPGFILFDGLSIAVKTLETEIASHQADFLSDDKSSSFEEPETVLMLQKNN